MAIIVSPRSLKRYAPAPARRAYHYLRNQTRTLGPEGLTLPAEVARVLRAQTHLNVPERFALYALVRGTRPWRALEIGIQAGGSAQIITSAMAANDRGVLVGVDPVVSIDPDDRWYHGRFQAVPQPSPQGVAAARQLVDGPFDLVHLDGINIYDQCRADLAAVLPVLADNAYLLVNNCFHYGVDQAVAEALDAEERLHDAGYLSSRATAEVLPNHAYGGLRLLRFGPRRVAPQPLIDEAFSAAGKAPPTYDPGALNDDVWFSTLAAARDQPSDHDG